MTIRDARPIPQLGLGVYQIAPGPETRDAVLAALRLGYRHVDTAQLYGNEADVGEALRRSELPRESVFVTTKLAPGNHGRDRAKAALDRSLRRLGLDHVDLFLIHFPVPGRRVETWRALVELVAEGKARSIGVSNFTARHVEELVAETGVWPSVNQIELSPFCQQTALVTYCQQHAIAVAAYAPLTQGRKLGHPTIAKIARRHRRSPAQIMLRWAIQRGFAVIAKTVTPERMVENAAVFELELAASELEQLASLDEEFRTCWDPTAVP